ncbi:MAG: glycosyltransferase [Chthoniobacter sp.]|nr:glycosyltransferase [Chthoniobacter sp.]
MTFRLPEGVSLRVSRIPFNLGSSMPTRFSIITPSFRQLDWLKLCAASVGDQVGVEVEHIVQDAGTGPELEQWAKGRKGLALHVERDSGMYDAINRGLRRATGEILAHLNCDEQYLPGALASIADYFDRHPDVDVVYGNAVVVDTDGRYLCSRFALPPMEYHTWICTLSVFTAATFFRRRLIDEENLFFSDEWRAVGDAVWNLELLRRKIRVGLLGTTVATFTFTGDNLITAPGSVQEQVRLRESAPAWAQHLQPLWTLLHRLRRLGYGNYRPKPLSYAIFTQSSSLARQTFVVERPTFRWPKNG